MFGAVLAVLAPVDTETLRTVRTAGAARTVQAAQTVQPPQAAQVPPSRLDLANLFAAGNLVLDENGDGIPDRLGASFVLAEDATPGERAAAAEIAARLGFETMALDLPVERGMRPGKIGVLVGQSALADVGFSLADFGVDPLAEGDGTVATRTEGDTRWVAVLGGGEMGLRRAARFLAGGLPHVGTLSSPSLGDVGEELSVWIAAGDTPAPPADVAFPSVVVNGVDGSLRLAADLTLADAAGATVFDRLLALAGARSGESATGPDSADLRFPNVASIAVSVGGREVVIPVRATPPPPGPVPARPGTGNRDEMDLSSVYSTDGFLADSDGNEIPDRIEVIVVPGERAMGVADLTARMGLESTGLTVPLVIRPGEIEDAARGPVTVLVGIADGHPFIAELADSGKVGVGDLSPGEGLVEFVPDAFGSKASLVVTGADPGGAALATRRLAEVFPSVGALGSDTPTFDDVEYELWGTLSGRTPAGQAAIGLYKLDRIVAELADEEIAGAEILVSLEKPAPGFEAVVRERAGGIGADRLSVTIDDRDVENAATIFDESFPVPWEVDRFWSVFQERVVNRIELGAPVHLEARLSEPPEVREAVAEEARRRLVGAGADPEGTVVLVLSAFKQGFSWIRESVAPRLEGEALEEIVIEFLRNEPPAEWPQQAMHTPLRWLHEIFPVDEVLAADLGLALDRIRFEMATDGPVYRIRALGPGARTLLDESFEPAWVLRPYFDRFRDYEQVRVTTGWIRAISGADTLADERIVTDPEWFWDRFQARTLPAVYDYVMDRHAGNPRGEGTDAPYFGTFTVELELSEPDYRLGVDNEIISPMDALHEEVYFGTIEFFHLIGRNARGQELTYPGRVIPVMRPKADGGAGNGRIRFTGFATSRPAVVVRYERRDGSRGERRLDIPKITMERPSLRRAVVTPGTPALRRLDLRVRVDSEADQREALLGLARGEQVDARMISAEQVAATLANLAALRGAGLHPDALTYEEVGEIGVWAEWTHEQDPGSRVTAVLPANGIPAARSRWSDLVPEGWTPDGTRIVQWETPIPPPEGDTMLAKLRQAFEHASMYPVGKSYLGRTIWAMDLMSPIVATHWARAKATTFKPTVIYSARQHANEVSSTSHVLRHAELLLTDPAQRAKLDKVNVVIHPFTNPDGAQLAYDLYGMTPDYILHAGYLGSLGMDVTSGVGQDFPLYPEANVRNRLWAGWLPDIFLNPHGYPSHQVVQLFSEYTGLVRRGRVTERNWGFNKGWFMPGFGYVDDPRYPRHKDAAFKLRDYITAGINSNRDVFEMNQRNYARYHRYGAAFDKEVFRLPMTDSVLIEMPLKGSGGQAGGRGFNPKVTIWSGTTEAPDETAHGEWMELVAKAGLSWDQAVLDYLYDGNHEVERSGSKFFGGVTLKMDRPRPPKVSKEGK